MFSHITLGSNDLAKAEVFYDAVLTPLGLRQRTGRSGRRAACALLGIERHESAKVLCL